MHYYSLEILVYIFLILWVVYKTDAPALFSGIGRSKTIVICLIIFLALLGQSVKDNDLFYPFASWGMYSNPYPGNNYMEYRITLDDGSQLHYPFNEVTHFSKRAFMRKVQSKEHQVNTADSLELDQAEKDLNNMLSGLVRSYENRNPEVEVKRFELNQVRVPQSISDGEIRTDTTSRHILELTDEK